MHLNMCIPHLFNKHSLALIIYDNTSEETSKHSAVDARKVSKPLLRKAAPRAPAPRALLGQGLQPHSAKESRGAMLRAIEESEVVFDFLKETPTFSKENNEQYCK